jgi:NitT/TauT family transport system substrate-binding protein
MHRLTGVRLIFLLVVALPMAWLAGCHREEPPLRVGTYPWVGFSTLQHAQSLGYFQEARIVLVDFSGARDVMSAFGDGSIDAAGLTLDETLRVLHTGKAGVVALVFGHSKGGDAVVTQPGIRAIADLRGRRVGMERGTEGEYLLARMLAEAELERSDVELVEIDAEDQEEAFRSGAVEALVTMDPVRARLLGLGAHEIFSSREIEGELIDVLLVRESVLVEQPEGLKRLVEAHFRSLDEMRQDPMAAALRLAPRFGSPSNILTGFGLVEFAGRGANLRLLGKGDFRNVALRTEKFMVRHGLIGNEKAEALEVDDRFVRDSR